MADEVRDSSLTLTLRGTGQSITVPIATRFATVPASALAALKLIPTCPPLSAVLAGLKNTTAFRTKISHIEGGRCTYRGYDVRELVEADVDFLEVAHLLIHGRLLASEQEQREWGDMILHHTYIHAELERQMQTFRYDAHPMGMLIASIASLSTFHPESNPALCGEDLYMNPKSGVPEAQAATKRQATRVARNKVICRMLGKISTIAANAYRHRLGRQYNHPMPGCHSYAENLLYMMDKLNEPDYRPDARLVVILNRLLVLLAEHGSNCATVTMRHLASSGVDPYTALAGAAGALFGERKASAVLLMLRGSIRSPAGVPAFLEQVKRRQLVGNRPIRLMGFGSRVYTTDEDPRVPLCKALALQLFDLFERDEVGETALALEAAVLADPYFMERQLRPNIDYWTAVVLHTLGFPEDMFPVIMCISRSVGFIAHWQETLDDPEFKIYRPRQIYKGVPSRKYANMPLDGESGPAGGAPSSGDGETTHPPLPPSLETLGYVKSDPVAAQRRSTAELVSAAEMSHLIATTQSSLSQLVLDLTSLSVEGAPAASGALEYADRLQHIQRNLNLLLRHQLVPGTGVAATSRTPGPPSMVAALPSAPVEASPSRDSTANQGRTTAGAPNLLAGSKAPRVMLPKS